MMGCLCVAPGCFGCKCLVYYFAESAEGFFPFWNEADRGPQRDTAPVRIYRSGLDEAFFDHFLVGEPQIGDIG
jgi:hypothetical protein